MTQDAGQAAEELKILAQELVVGSLALGASLPAPAPTMGKLAKISYTHDAMIDLIVANPGISQNKLAAHFGYTPSWISNIMASDAFQARLDQRRKEVVDPTIVATVEERILGMTLRSIDVVMEAMDKPQPDAKVALRAFELGARGLGLGGNAPPPATPVDLDKLAERLIALNKGPRSIPGVVLEKEITVG